MHWLLIYQILMWKLNCCEFICDEQSCVKLSCSEKEKNSNLGDCFKIREKSKRVWSHRTVMRGSLSGRKLCDMCHNTGMLMSQCVFFFSSIQMTLNWKTNLTLNELKLVCHVACSFYCSLAHKIKNCYQPRLKCIFHKWIRSKLNCIVLEKMS